MRRRTLRILLLLILGAIVNVAVAWGCAFRDPPTITTRGLTDRLITWPAYLQSSGWPVPDSYYHLWGGIGMDVYMIEGSTPKASGPMNTTVSSAWVTIGEVGWPSRSMKWHILAASGPEMNPLINAGIAKMPFRIGGVPAPQLTSNPSYRLLPLVFIPGGTFWNTVFFAVLIWLVFIAPRAVRRELRIRRRQCEQCGYDLRGQYSRGSDANATGCPECGWGRVP